MAPADEDVFTTWTKDLNGAAVAVVYLCGELDASSVPAFLTDMHGITDSGKSIMMDTHLLSYIDSTGVGALFSIKQALRAKGHGLCIVGAHGLLSKILDVTRLNREVNCYESADEAMAEINSPGW